MNKFAKMYKHEREKGNSEYEVFGIVASYIALQGDFNDLNAAYDFFSEDLQETNDKFFNSNLTSYERDMKLFGHKESDFE